jgi:hypothetical protein
MLAPHSLAGSLGWTAVAVAVPTLLRLAIDGGRSGIPFITYFPAIVLVALFLGWRCGVLAALASAAAARLLFMQGEPRLVETPEGVAIIGLFVLSCALLISIGETLRRTFAELQAGSSREELLNEELRHRMKDMIAVAPRRARPRDLPARERQHGILRLARSGRRGAAAVPQRLRHSPRR